MSNNLSKNQNKKASSFNFNKKLGSLNINLKKTSVSNSISLKWDKQNNKLTANIGKYSASLSVLSTPKLSNAKTYVNNKLGGLPNKAKNTLTSVDKLIGKYTSDTKNWLGDTKNSILSAANGLSNTLKASAKPANNKSTKLTDPSHWYDGLVNMVKSKI